MKQQNFSDIKGLDRLICILSGIITGLNFLIGVEVILLLLGIIFSNWWIPFIGILIHWTLGIHKWVIMRANGYKQTGLTFQKKERTKERN